MNREELKPRIISLSGTPAKRPKTSAKAMHTSPVFILRKKPKKMAIKRNTKDNINSKLPLFRLYGYGDNAKKVFDIIYKDADIYLQRKYDRYLQYMK